MNLKTFRGPSGRVPQTPGGNSDPCLRTAAVVNTVVSKQTDLSDVFNVYFILYPRNNSAEQLINCTVVSIITAGSLCKTSNLAEFRVRAG